MLSPNTFLFIGSMLILGAAAVSVFSVTGILSERRRRTLENPPAREVQ